MVGIRVLYIPLLVSILVLSSNLLWAGGRECASLIAGLQKKRETPEVQEPKTAFELPEHSKEKLEAEGLVYLRSNSSILRGIHPYSTREELNFLSQEDYSKVPEHIRHEFERRISLGDEIDPKLIRQLYLRAKNEASIQQSKNRVALLNTQNVGRMKLKGSDFSELMGHQLYLAKEGQIFSVEEFRSTDPKIHQKAVSDLFSLSQLDRTQLLLSLAYGKENPEIKRKARHYLIAMGVDITYTPEMLEEIKMELSKVKDRIPEALAQELTQLTDEQFLSLNIDLKHHGKYAAPMATSLMRGRSFETQIKFLESNQVPKETIHVYRTQYEQGLVRARQLLESDLPEERRLAVEKLKYLPFQTPEVRSLLLEIGERESVSLNKYAAARAAIPSANGRISTEHLNGSESEAFVNFASAVTRERVHEAAEKTEDKLHESVLRPPQKGPRWFDGSQNPVSSRTARGLDAYYFANHVYGLPEVNLEGYLKNNSRYTESFIEERNNWESGLRAGWQVRESVADPKTGLKAAVYSSLESKSQRSKVYAFGGTECKKDCMADVGLGRVQLESPHFQRLIESAAKDVAEGGDILVTGHSLGGGLAQAFTYFATKRARELRDSWTEAERTQVPVGKVSTVTWQAFGARSLVTSAPSYSPKEYSEVPGVNNNLFPKAKEGTKIPVQMENYRLPGEPISLVGQFLGPLYDIGGGDPKSKMSRFPNFSKHFLEKSEEPAFIKNGLETATLSAGFQIPEAVVSLVKGTLGKVMARKIDSDFTIQWKDYFSAAMKAREEWERRFGYQRDDFQPSNDLTQIEPQYLGFNYQTPWLKRELLVLAEQAPPQLKEWAERVLRVTEDSIQKLREQKRSSPFKIIPANDRPKKFD